MRVGRTIGVRTWLEATLMGSRRGDRNAALDCDHAGYHRRRDRDCCCDRSLDRGQALLRVRRRTVPAFRRVDPVSGTFSASTAALICRSGRSGEARRGPVGVGVAGSVSGRWAPGCSRGVPLVARDGRRARIVVPTGCGPAAQRGELGRAHWGRTSGPPAAVCGGRVRTAVHGRRRRPRDAAPPRAGRRHRRERVRPPARGGTSRGPGPGG